MDVKAGTRLRCEECGAELVVIKAEGPELTCCGKPLSSLTASKPASSS